MLVATLGLALLSYAEHTRAVRPSSILNTFLFATLLFDIVHARTLWLRAANHVEDIISYVATAAAAVRSALVVLEALDKRRSLRPEYQAYPPEATTSLYNRTFFWWLNPLFLQGFRREIDVDDLFVLDKHLKASYGYQRFHTAWTSSMLFSFFFLFLLLTPHIIFPLFRSFPS